jgi:hypothetical protein
MTNTLNLEKEKRGDNEKERRPKDINMRKMYKKRNDL